MSHRSRIAIGLTFALLFVGLWAGAPAVQACHTALHCVQEEVEEQVDPFVQLVPEDAYVCTLEGRSTTWTYVGGFPNWGAYRFEGEARCLHLDRNGGSDGADDTGARLAGTFRFGGEHSQLLGLPVCTMQLDGLHVLPADYGQIVLSGDGESPILFRHEMDVAAGQGDFEFHDDGNAANGVVDGSGAVSLVPTDVIENAPDTDPGCVTSQAPGFFIEAMVIAGVF